MLTLSNKPLLVKPEKSGSTSRILLQAVRAGRRRGMCPRGRRGGVHVECLQAPTTVMGGLSASTGSGWVSALAGLGPSIEDHQTARDARGGASRTIIVYWEISPQKPFLSATLLGTLFPARGARKTTPFALRELCKRSSQGPSRSLKADFRPCARHAPCRGRKGPMRETPDGQGRPRSSG